MPKMGDAMTEGKVLRWMKRPGAQVTRADARVKVCRVARKLAAEHQVDLSAVRGTGPEGRITKEDVEAVIAAAPSTPAAAAAGAAPDAPPRTPTRQPAG